MTSGGKFITLEGIEGAGKTTHMQSIRVWLETQGESVVLTREPGDTPPGLMIRQILLGNHGLKLSNDTELLLFFADRVQHIQDTIIPAIKRGDCVVCDRFTDSTRAYQSGGRGIDPKRIDVLEEWVQRGLRPDLTILFDLPIKLGLARVDARGTGKRDRFEQEEIDFFSRVREHFLFLASRNPDRYRIVDASKSVTKVLRQTIDVLKEWYSPECRTPP